MSTTFWDIQAPPDARMDGNYEAASYFTTTFKNGSFSSCVDVNFGFKLLYF